MRKRLVLLSLAMLLLFIAGCTGGGGPILTGSLVGYVLNSVDQTPVAGINVKVFDDWYTTDESGYFYYRYLPAANHTLVVDELGWEYHKEIVAIQANQEAQIAVVLTPVPQVGLSGTVYDYNGQPVEDAYIYVSREDRYFEDITYSDVDGSYAFNLWPGLHSVKISYYDTVAYEYVTNIFQVEVSQDTVHDFYLWGADFTITTGINPTLSWPTLNIGIPVAYEIRLSKASNTYNMSNLYFIDSYYTTDTTQQFGNLECGGWYQANVIAIDQNTGVPITNHHYLFEVYVEQPTAEQQVVGFLNGVAMSYNEYGPFILNEMISETFIDAQGRNKQEFIQYLADNYDDILFYNINVTPTVDAYGVLNAAHVEMMIQSVQWDGYDQFICTESVSCYVVVENGEIFLSQVY